MCSNILFQNKGFFWFPERWLYSMFRVLNIKITIQNQREDGINFSLTVETTWSPLPKIVYCTKLLKEFLCTLFL